MSEIGAWYYVTGLFIFFLIINIYFPGNINVYLPRLSASDVEVVAMMTRKATNLFILSKL